MQGTVKITVELINPTDTWEHEQPVDFPPGAEKAIVMQILAGVRAMGLIKQLSDSEVEIVPEHRVVRYLAKLNTVMLADNLDAAKAVSRNKLIV